MASWFEQKHHRVTVFFVVTVIMASLFFYKLRHPQNDWDMFPYMTIALMDSGESLQVAHHHVYEALRARVPPAVFHELTDKFSIDKPDRVYRAQAALDPAKFAESLPLYTVKPAYPVLIAGLYKAGVDLVIAPRILAGLGWLLSCLLIYIWIQRWMSPVIAATIAIILSQITQLTAVSTLTTPDSMSLFVILLGIYLSFEREYVTSGMIILMLSVLIRPENILYVLAFGAYFFLNGGKRSIVLGLAFIAIGLYLFIVRSNEYYGWRTYFYFTFVDRSISLPTFVSPLTFWDYVRIYRQQVAIAIAEPAEGLAIFVLVAFGAAAMKIRSGNLRDPYLHLVYLVGILAIGRILVMPESFYRALLPCYLMATVALIHACVFSKTIKSSGRASPVSNYI